MPRYQTNYGCFFHFQMIGNRDISNDTNVKCLSEEFYLSSFATRHFKRGEV